jgi:hypothetical protein
MRRIGNRSGIQFDVPTKDFMLWEGGEDLPPLEGSFDLSPKNGQNSHSVLNIFLEQPPRPMTMAIGAFARIEKRPVLDDQGHVVGEDTWGYQSSEKRWRTVEFPGFVAAQYSLINGTDARLFDSVISSACLAPAAGP